LAKRKSTTSTAEARKSSAQALLKTLGQSVYSDLDEGRFPSLTLASRSVRNIVYDKKLQQFILGATTVKKSSANIKHIRPFTQLVWLASFAKKLVDEKRTSTLRDVFYSAQAFDVEFQDQAESDELITDLEVLMQMAREGMNIYPEERSAIFGNMTIEYTVPGYEGKRADLSANPDGVMIGPALTTAEFADTDAEMVLAIEKGGLFTRFIEERVHEKHKALLINTAGQPPRSTRYLLRRLNKELKLPVGILCDADPWGAHIAMVCKSGSANSAHLRELTTPDAVWLGVWASVTGDEPVVMEIDGLMRNEEIGEVYSRLSGGRSGSITFPHAGRVNALSCTSEGRVGVMPVNALTRHPYDGDIYEFRTLGGYAVKTTGNHSIEVFNPATYLLESRPASTISDGDLLAACFRVPDNQSLKELNFAQLIASECPDEADKIFVDGEEAKRFCDLILGKYDKRRVRRDFYQILKRRTPKLSYFLNEGVLPARGFLRLRYSKNTVPVSVDLSEEFGRLLGYHTAEGNPGLHGRGGICELTFGGTENDYVNDAVRCIKETFGLDATIRERKNRLDVQYGAKLLSTIFVKALRTGAQANNKCVPFVIFNAPDEVKKEYLRGCFRGDRMVNYLKGTRLSLKTVSRKLASDLTILLRQLGCVSYVWKGGDAFVVSCADVSPIQGVVDEVCRKPVSTHSAIRSMPGALIYPLRDEIKSLVSYGRKSQIHQALFTNHGQTRVGYDRLTNAFRMFERPTQNERVKTLMNLVQNDVVLLPVKRIRNLGRASSDVYDLEVEDVHTFVGGVGGLVLHNSDILKYKLPSDKLTEIDIKRLYELKEDPRYTDKMWHEELDTFLKIKRKSEQEAFARYGLSYIVDTYLPEKLQLMKSA
jgi:DNA topoisomerase-6 subunit A